VHPHVLLTNSSTSVSASLGGPVLSTVAATLEGDGVLVNASWWCSIIGWIVDCDGSGSSNTPVSNKSNCSF